MISHKYLNNKKGAAYSYFSALSTALLPALLVGIVQFALAVLTPLLTFVSYNSTAKDDITAKEKLSKLYDFRIYGSTDLINEFTVYIILGVIGILSVFTAVRLFSFICDKKTVNVYYSLGVKRSTLFLTKYAGGVTLLALAHAIPVTLSYIINVIFLGPSIRMSLSLLHMFTGFFIFSLIFFSVTSAVFSCVGTVAEAVVHSTVLVFSPTVIFFVLEQILSNLLPNSVYNIYARSFESVHYGYSTAVSDSLITATSKYNPLLFFAEDIMNYSVGKLEEGKVISAETGKAWSFPLTYELIPWFGVCLLCTLFGLFMFKRLKAENCGFLNTNKVLGNYSIFVLCFFASTLFFSEMRWEGPTTVFVAGGICAFIVYLIAEIFLKRNFKKIVTTLYKFVAHACVIAIIFAIIANGAFGYDTRLPDKTKIESVQVAVPFSYSQISTKSSDFGYTFENFLFAYEADNYYRYLPEFTTEKDIETVRSLHEDLISDSSDDGTECQVLIKYNYKDGGSFSRLISVKNAFSERKLFTLFETDAYKAQLKNLFFDDTRVEDLKSYIEKNEYYYDYEMLNDLAFEYEYSQVSVTSSSLYEHTDLSLTKEQFNEIKKAIYDDLSTQTANDMFLSNDRQLGVITLSSAVSYEELLPDGYYTTDIPGQPAIAPDDRIDEDDSEFDEEPIEDDGTEENRSYQGNTILGNLGYENSGYQVIVTDKMTNTLNFLNKYGLSNLLTSKLQIESVSLAKSDFEALLPHYYESTQIYDFWAYTGNITLYDDMTNEALQDFEESFSNIKITDKQTLEKFDQVMKLHEYASKDGYLCLVKYTGNIYCVKYVSAEDCPQF